MNVRYFLLALPALFSTALSAAPGDHHTVTDRKTALLVQADKNAGATTQLRQGEEVMEMSRRGDWVEVFVVGLEASGWVHKLAIQTLPENRKSADELAIKKFKQLLHAYNRRTQAMKGYQPFTDASLKHDNTLELSVSDAWLGLDKNRRYASLISMHSLWRKISAQGQTLVRAVDGAGNELLLYPRQTALLKI